ncbi:MAG: DUF4270 family protein [Sediminibacterium sp.]
MRNALFLLCAFALVVFNACKKPTDLQADGLLPQEDVLNANQTDTASIVSYIVREDTLSTDELSACLLGSYSDETFGRTIASFSTQFVLSGASPSFPETFEVDSVIFSVAYSGYSYGSMGDGYLSVKELSADLPKSASFNSSYNAPVLNENLLKDASQTFQFKPKTYLFGTQDSLAPQLRIPLKTSLGTRLMHPADSTVLDSDENFQAYFKGLKVEAGSYPMGVVGLDLTNINSKITVYYRFDNGGLADTAFYEFPVTSDCGRYSHLQHFYQFATQPELLELSSTDTIANQSQLFLQAGAGTKIKLELPHLLDFQTSAGRIVNRAELILPFELDSRYAPSSQIFIFYQNNEGNLVALPDQFSGTIGGGLELTNKRYKLNITQYIQKVISGDLENSPLFIVSGAAGVSVNRTIIHGPEFSENNVENSRLVITYSN